MSYIWISCCIFFFFKQKTAYEMRISDWSSDVCSSDLHGIDLRAGRPDAQALQVVHGLDLLLAGMDQAGIMGMQRQHLHAVGEFLGEILRVHVPQGAAGSVGRTHQRSEERRVGNECVSPCIYGCSRYN